MSYILKALKKSEAERAKGAVPRLTGQHMAAPRTRGAVWPWVVGAALMVNATVVVFAAWGPEIPLLSAGGRPDAGDPVAASSAPQPTADTVALDTAAPGTPAKGTEPLRPAPPQPAPRAQQTATEATPANSNGQLAGTQAAQPRAAQSRPAEQPQASPSSPPAPQSQTPPSRGGAPSIAPQPGSAAGSQTAPPSPPTAQPQAAPPRAAAQQQAPRAATAKQDTRTQSAAVGAGVANRAAAEQARDDAGNAPPPAAARPPAADPAAEAATPLPARKPREALSRPARRQVLGDPLPLGGLGAPQARGPDLALAAPEPEPPATEAPPEPELDPYAGVPMLWQLPSAIRSKLPQLSISVHVYSPEAAGRFVIVDRSKYREGDVLTGGAKLEAIVADGIVLDYQGRRYRIGN